MALTVQRLSGESVWIGGVRVTIAKVRGGQVHLTLDCSSDHEILREELVGSRPEIPGKFAHPVPRDRVVVDGEGTGELVISGKQQG